MLERAAVVNFVAKLVVRARIESCTHGSRGGKRHAIPCVCPRMLATLRCMSFPLADALGPVFPGDDRCGSRLPLRIAPSSDSHLLTSDDLGVRRWRSSDGFLEDIAHDSLLSLLKL
jgi:hypothetical protein